MRDYPDDFIIILTWSSSKTLFANKFTFPSQVLGVGIKPLLGKHSSGYNTSKLISRITT